MTRQCVRGPGHFQWNAGGWFGSQFGGTMWLVVGAAVLAASAPLAALTWAACFVVANAAGWWLWQRRDRLRPYPAMQALVLVCGVVALVAMAALDLIGTDDGMLGKPVRRYLALLVFPGLLVLFGWLE